MTAATSQDGTRIAYDKVGLGPVLILVPPAIQYRAIDPKVGELAALLGEERTVITYDRRGRGESGNTEPYAVEREIEDIEALIDAAGGHAALFGHSSGAVLAIEAAAELGAKVDRLMLYEPPSPAARNFPIDYVERLERAAAAGDRDAVAETFFRDGIGLPPPVVDGMKQSPFWQVVKGIAHTLPYDARIVVDGYHDGKFPARWQKVTVPTLVIGGDATPAEAPHLAISTEAIGRALPNAQRATLKGQNHGPAPEALAPVLHQFLREPA